MSTQRKSATKTARPTTDYTLIFDGGSLGNPGQGYGSYVLVRNLDGKRRVQRLRFEGMLTSNQAEYRTLIAGVEDLLSTIRGAGRSPGDFSLEVRGDSQLVIQQTRGQWKVRDLDLRDLKDRASDLLGELGKVRLIWQRRRLSERAVGH
ncbi:MAG: ribonuclease HI family protein [Chloroflexi bacterium]|nr:ribonuclease HI family protein [Chloroflexota bacterium]